GNAISYVYNENNANGEYTLSSINYADSLIGLTYEGRSDVSTSYQAGSKLRQTKRLSNITTYVNNNIVRTYDLEYQYYSTPKKSQLISIKECVNGQCLPKTEFDWQKDIDNSWQVNAIITDICANESGNYGVCNDDDNYKHIRFIDMNSDGKSDLVYRSDQGIQVHYSDGTSFNRRQSSSICANESRNHGVCNDSDNYNYMFYTDVNGDGNMDICNRADLGIRCHDNAQIHSKLRSITNGFNIKTIINYKPLTNPSVYTKGTNGNYPNIDTQNARQVVSSVVTDNAIGGQSTTTYKYGNAKVNIK
ncbi:toxin TcdB middle/N-terminal domain-containing protein, partial [Bathymodiolus thermophilus thioautotrophic gill symbiont]